MNAHTPGPWHVSAGSSPGNPRVIVESDAGLPVCALSLRGVQGDTRRMEANARLIAAAPDLLEACQTFAEWLGREDAGYQGERDTPEGECQWREWYDENMRLCSLAQSQARAALDRATGGES